MALLTFPWDDIGQPSSMSIDDICHTRSDPFGGGYSASITQGGRMQKIFRIVWPSMEPAEWIELLSFWRSVHGNADAFYFQIPTTIFGSPGWGGFNQAIFGEAVFGEATFTSAGSFDPDDGFDADQEVGFGDGPIHTCKFVDQSLPQQYLTGFSRWRVETSIREVV